MILKESLETNSQNRRLIASSSVSREGCVLRTTSPMDYGPGLQLLQVTTVSLEVGYVD